MCSRAITVLLVLACFTATRAQHVCTLTEQLGNIGYRFHQTLCSEYVQCHNDNVGNIFAVYMSCPFGQHWDQTNKRCVDIAEETCGLGSCVPISRLEDGGCAAYATCESPRTHNHTCCKEGHRFMGGTCMPDHTCTDPCPGTCATGEVCRSYPYWSDPRFYYHYHPEEGAVYERSCKGDAHFDIVQCGCVSTRKRYCITPYALRFAFNGFFSDSSVWSANPAIQLTDGEASFDISNSIITGNVRLGQPTLEDPLVIKLGYRPLTTVGGQFQTLFLSNDCKGCNQLRIGIQSDQFIATLSKDGRDVAEISMATTGFNVSYLVDAAVMYSGHEMTVVLRSQNLHYMKRTTAPPLTVMDCGVQISDEFNRFRGRLQYVAIYTCHYGGRVQNILDLPTFPIDN